MSLKSALENIGLNNEKKIFDYLNSIEELGSEKDIRYLMNILLHSESYWIINGSSLALTESKVLNEEIRNSLIKKLKLIKDKLDIGTLVYACSQFDNSEYFILFIKLILHQSDEVTMEAKAAISNMKRIKKKNFIVAYYTILEMKKNKKIVEGNYNEFERLKEFLKQCIGQKSITDEIESFF